VGKGVGLKNRIEGREKDGEKKKTIIKKGQLDCRFVIPSMLWDRSR